MEKDKKKKLKQVIEIIEHYKHFNILETLIFKNTIAISHESTNNSSSWIIGLTPDEWKHFLHPIALY
jgi:hypothetical protein